jgi:hypothetical protein
MLNKIPIRTRVPIFQFMTFDKNELIIIISYIHTSVLRIIRSRSAH